MENFENNSIFEDTSSAEFYEMPDINGNDSPPVPDGENNGMHSDAEIDQTIPDKFESLSDVNKFMLQMENEGHMETEHADEGVGEDTGSEGNDYLNYAANFFRAKGVDFNPEEYDAESFSEDDMDYVIGRYFAQKYYSNVDPELTMLAENGINMNEYMQHKNDLQQIIASDEVGLYKNYVYNYLKNQEMQIGTIRPNEYGQITQEQHEYIMKETDRRLSNIDESTMKQYGLQIKQNYQQQLDALPQQMMEQQQQLNINQMRDWNEQVYNNVSQFSKFLEKQNKIITEFSGQAEKDDYVSHMKNQLSYANIDGQPGIPLFHRLNNDPEFLANVLRLTQMLDKGYFTDIKNKERNAAFSQLSVNPVLNKNNKKKGAGSNSIFEDTSSADFWEKYK